MSIAFNLYEDIVRRKRLFTIVIVLIILSSILTFALIINIEYEIIISSVILLKFIVSISIIILLIATYSKYNEIAIDSQKYADNAKRKNQTTINGINVKV